VGVAPATPCDLPVRYFAPVSAYRTVVVGTDGSDSSLRAVRRAAALSGACGARLVIVCAYLPPRADDREVRRAQEVLGDDAYQVIGSAPAEDTVRTAAERAREAGATDVYPIAVVGSPVETLLDVVTREQGDLLVIGNRGLNSIKGRLLGSVPSDVTRRSTVDVLVVHTTG
jgi:nucleotide-binding universal stress UspA family protein